MYQLAIVPHPLGGKFTVFLYGNMLEHTTREAAAQRSSCPAMKSSPCAPQPEKAHSNEDPAHPQEKEKNKELKEATGEW